ncbi:antibiotic biosynthesis monooxygenase family protein [Roseateles sp. BYS180W]|uniref:Antibiotic biosynthesis monooxygenase family protein n=1 Tax=Roseateles rivi TaxID=3299028 RepID=A0ABW7FSJ8_9BURK
MISASFIFDEGRYDEAFHALDAAIERAVLETPGYLGQEQWRNEAQGRLCNVYYWSDESGLRALMQHPAHLQAKARYTEWLQGYRVVVSQVLRSYGDGLMAHPTSPQEPA